MNGAAAHAHRVDYRHSGSRDVVAVAYAAGRFPADVLSEFRAACLDEIEQALRLFIDRLGRTGHPAVTVDADLVIGLDGSESRIDPTI